MIIVHTTATPEALESAVDAEVARFEQWFKSKGNDALVRSERAILKTYFYWKLREEDTEVSAT